MIRLAVPAALAAILLMGGCATQAVPETRFLQDRNGFAVVDGNARRLVFAPTGRDLSAYRSVMIESVQIPASSLTPEESAFLASMFQDALMQALGTTRMLTTTPMPGTLRVRAAITAVTPNNVPLNVILSTVGVPLLNGGAAAEAEALDATTGERVAALVLADERRFSGLLGYYARTGHARAVLGDFANDFAAILRTSSVAQTRPAH
jgi:hypothetical protein